MANLKLTPAIHKLTGEAIVEVWDLEKDELAGVLYPTPTGVKLVSKYITNHPLLVTIDPGEPPAIIIRLDRTT
jgi:hypothetical protein